MASIEREVENALLNVVSGVTGVNFFTSERGTARTMPSVTVQAQIGSEELVPFSGVFKTPASITYVARADATARTAFDAKFYDILEQLYRSPDLASYLTDHSNLTFYVAKVTGDSPAVISQNRTWSRAMTLDITATAKKFLPSSLSGLSLWLKADAGVTLSGLNVTAWADQSGNGKNATPLTASPTLTTINSKSFISFNGVDQALVGENVISALPCTIISVLQVASYLGEDLWFEQYDAQDYIGLYANGNDFGWTAYNGAPFESTDSPWPTNTTQLATTIFDGANSASFHNGSLAGTGDSGDRTPAGSYYLSYFVPVDSYKNYKIAEIIVYNRAITTPERQQVEAYLNTKYAIY